MLCDPIPMLFMRLMGYGKAMNVVKRFNALQQFDTNRLAIVTDLDTIEIRKGHDAVQSLLKTSG